MQCHNLPISVSSFFSFDAAKQTTHRVIDYVLGLESAISPKLLG